MTAWNPEITRHNGPMRFQRTLVATPPPWWKDYRNRVRANGYSYFRHRVLCQDFPSSSDSFNQTSRVRYYRSHLMLNVPFKVNGRAQQQYFRRIIKHPDKVMATFGALLIDIGQGVYMWMRPDTTVFDARRALHRALDHRVSSARDGVVLSRYSACRFYGAPLLIDPPETHYATEKKSGKRRFLYSVCSDGIDTTVKVFPHIKDPTDEVRVYGDIAVTSKLQTLLDVLAFMPAPDFSVPGDFLLRALLEIPNGTRYVNPENYERVQRELFTLLDAKGRLYNKRKVRRRFAMLSPLAESPLESLCRLMCLRAGLPMPQVQFQIAYLPLSNGIVGVDDYYDDYYGDYRNFYVDMAWPQYGLGIEVDGLGKYSDLQSIREEKNRENIIKQKLPRIIRVTNDTLKDWSLFVGLLQQQLL